MAKHFYDPLVAHFIPKAPDSTQMSAHGLYGLADQMKPVAPPQRDDKDKDKKCSFLHDAIALLTRH